jgi:hypothetical protein
MQIRRAIRLPSESSFHQALVAWIEMEVWQHRRPTALLKPDEDLNISDDPPSASHIFDEP